MLNRTDRSSPMTGEAEVKYLDGDFRVVRPGAFVRCAVTGVPIPLEELKYWSVELQEAYANPESVLQRHFPDAKRQTTENRGRLSIFRKSGHRSRVYPRSAIYIAQVGYSRLGWFSVENATKEGI